jgi:hypothetical protein
MFLFLGIPGFLMSATLTFPWSGLAIALWSLALWQATRRTRVWVTEPGAFAARGCASAPLIFSGLLVPWVTARWPDPLTAALFWAPPAVLLALAVFGGREHAYYKRGALSIIVPLAVYQVQLMAYGALMLTGHILNGSSPI